MIEPEFLLAEQLEQFRNIIRAYVFKSYGQRSFSYVYLQFNDMTKWRCRNCSRSFLYFKSRKKYYCSEECAMQFFSHYDFTKIQAICMHRSHYRCQKCGISILKIIEEEGFVKEYIEYKWFDIDHIQEIATGNTAFEQAQLFFDINNLQVLCKECHKQKTAKFLSERFTKNISTKLTSQQLLDFV